MSKETEEENTEKVLKEFIEYWDDWHADWAKNIKGAKKPKEIVDWKVPNSLAWNWNNIYLLTRGNYLIDSMSKIYTYPVSVKRT